MNRKLKEQRGETLVEVLASILIGSLSVALLFGAVMASANLDRQAQELDETYYEDLAKAERQAAGDASADLPSGTKVTVKNSDPAVSIMEADLPVTFYGGKSAVSYALDPPLPPPGGGGP